MAIVVGIDPGINNTGVAVLDESGKVLSVKLIERKHKKLTDNTRQQSIALRSFLYSSGGSAVIVELPRIYPHKPQRANDQMDLSFMAGALLMTALAVPGGESKTLKTATPKEWKGTTPKDIHNRRVLRSAIGLEPLLSPYKRSTHEHIIDAAGLALWALGKGA